MPFSLKNIARNLALINIFATFSSREKKSKRIKMAFGFRIAENHKYCWEVPESNSRRLDIPVVLTIWKWSASKERRFTQSVYSSYCLSLCCWRKVRKTLRQVLCVLTQLTVPILYWAECLWLMLLEEDRCLYLKYEGCKGSVMLVATYNSPFSICTQKSCCKTDLKV